MHFIPSIALEGFYLGPFYLYTWGLTAAIGVVVAIWLAERKIPSSKSQVYNTNLQDQFWNLAIMLVIAVFLGARVLYIFETWNYYAADPLKIFQIWEGGFSFFGGAAGAILAGYIWSKSNKIDFLYLGYIFTPAWLFGMFFGRLGCFLIHDHLGKPTDLPWGIYLQGAYRHEPAGYELLWLLLIGTALFLIDKKLYLGKSVVISKLKNQTSNKITNPKNQLGFFHWDFIGNLDLKFGHLPRALFPLSLLLYSFGRFFLDFTRAEDDRFLDLTVAQWACIVGFIWSILVIKAQQKKKNTPDVQVSKKEKIS